MECSYAAETQEHAKVAADCIVYVKSHSCCQLTKGQTEFEFHLTILPYPTKAVYRPATSRILDTSSVSQCQA